ncbi:TetR/AcrR family transcriptional regulator [Agromyces bauzanensis]|uniref:HTH tetR-type domain-containing protein n=1 Tax=Agromyces bauzanensis TaxID=1308924 RepID=A0A917PLH9_9MICO|nr:TetR/AcrR family transcriptional regulator [Agromyces bauzanensis]GGJ83370.1 hypothetical protein GCM10011372_22120 [Agromyces bauzanensis]
MPETTHPTRQLLLDAGLAAAESGTLAGTTVDDVVRAAGVSKGTFYVHFTDRSAYLVELHRSFYDALGARVRAAMTDLPPGADRLRRGTEVYLNACLSARGVRAMLLDVRSDPVVAVRIREHNAHYLDLVAEDLDALATPDPGSAGRLFVAAVHETALAELEEGREQPRLRRALWRIARIAPTR